jgi:hypothetical protein
MDYREIPRLYYSYGSCDKKRVQEILDSVMVVVAKTDIKVPKTDEVSGHVAQFSQRYYALNEKAADRMKKDPRGLSLTFHLTETVEEPEKDLVPYKHFKFLTKSTSRFFLKPDIGEVLDQLNFDDFTDELAAICIEDGHELLDGTEGEHCVMTATLLKRK